MGAKISFLEIFQASQREESEKLSKVSLITWSKGESNLGTKLCRVAITVDDSPSRMNFFSCIEKANSAASLAARACPFTWLHGSLIWVIICLISPLLLLHTAASMEKEFLIIALKDTLHQSWGGLVHVCFLGFCFWNQAAICSEKTLLMFSTNFRTSGMTPLCTAWFLVNHIMSHITAAKIWKEWESAKGIPKKQWGFKMPLIQSDRLREAHFSESRGHGEKLQVILAKKHLKKRWERESFSPLHRGQINLSLGMERTWFNLLLERTVSQAIFQRNNLSLSLSFNFQRCFQFEKDNGEVY